MPPAAEPRGLPDGGTSHAVAAKGITPATFPRTAAVPDIIDIRRAAVEFNLKGEILSMFRPERGPRQLPTLLLYDEKGLQLFERVRMFTSARLPFIFCTNRTRLRTFASTT